jgi:hypothetical protein
MQCVEDDSLKQKHAVVVYTTLAVGRLTHHVFFGRQSAGTKKRPQAELLNGRKISITKQRVMRDDWRRTHHYELNSQHQQQFLIRRRFAFVYSCLSE